MTWAFDPMCTPGGMPIRIVLLHYFIYICVEGWMSEMMFNL